MKPSELQAHLREKLDPAAEVHDMTDDGGYGLVRWSRPADGGTLRGLEPAEVKREHIVHRWAVKDTDGATIPFMVWSGGYYFNDEAGARADYRARPS